MMTIEKLMYHAHRWRSNTQLCWVRIRFHWPLRTSNIPRGPPGLSRKREIRSNVCGALGRARDWQCQDNFRVLCPYRVSTWPPVVEIHRRGSAAPASTYPPVRGRPEAPSPNGAELHTPGQTFPKLQLTKPRTAKILETKTSKNAKIEEKKKKINCFAFQFWSIAFLKVEFLYIEFSNCFSIVFELQSLQSWEAVRRDPNRLLNFAQQADNSERNVCFCLLRKSPTLGKNNYSRRNQKKFCRVSELSLPGRSIKKNSRFLPTMPSDGLNHYTDFFSFERSAVQTLRSSNNDQGCSKLREIVRGAWYKEVRNKTKR